MLSHVGLVSLTRQLALRDVAPVGAALQKQVGRDFGPLWNIEASVDSFERLEDVPADYWLITIEDSNESVMPGIHSDENFQPFARITFNNVWPLVLSHELLEMLADPFGSKLVAGPSIRKAGERVRYLVEVCDPCQDPHFAYSVNGVLVSDFLTPQYYQPEQSPAARYSFTGKVAEPREVLPGGYLAWQEGTGAWWQKSVSAEGGDSISQLTLPPTGATLRYQIDQASPQRRWMLRGLAKNHPVMKRNQAERAGAASASRTRAKTMARTYGLRATRRASAASV
jgi:hypothetical protein